MEPAAGGRSLVRRGAAAAALQLALQARGLIQVPVLARTLSPEEFGSLTLALGLASIAGVIALLGLHTGFFLNLVRLDAQRTRGPVLSVLAPALPIVAGLSLLAAWALAAGMRAGWLPRQPETVAPLSLLIAGQALREIVLVVPRARQDIGYFAGVSLLSHYGGMLAGLGFVLLGGGAAGFLSGLALGALCGGALGFCYSLRESQGPAAWDGPFFVQVLRSAAPVVPMALGQVALFSLDYAIVGRFLGPAALASYGLAYTLASPVMLAVAALNFTLLPEYVARQRRGDAELARLVERVLTWGWTGGLLAVALAVGFGPVAASFLAGPRYREAGALLPCIVAAYTLFALGQALHVLRSARKGEVRATSAVTVACALLAALASFWAVPRYGVEGAALVTLASFLLYFVALTVIATPVLPAPLASLRPWAPLLAMAAAPVLQLLATTTAARALLAAGLCAIAVAFAASPRSRDTAF